MATRTKVVILMHPYEYRHIKLNTGRLTHFCLSNSELIVGETFDENERVQVLIRDPKTQSVLLYPGEDAFDLSEAECGESGLAERPLVVFVLDATWRLARPMLRFSKSLKRLPRVMFSGAEPSRYVIKKQPEPGCLSTLESVHELLLALDHAGLDHYPDKAQLVALFMKMQRFQVGCAEANQQPGFVPRRIRSEGTSTVGGELETVSKRRRVFPKSRSEK